MTDEADCPLPFIAPDAADVARIHTRVPGVTRVHSSFALRRVVRKPQVPLRAAARP